MNTKKQLMPIIGLLVILLPSICYAYFMIIDPIQRTMGVVYFNHNKHLDKNIGPGFPCEDCHHELKTPEQKPTACTTCHKEKNEAQDQNAPIVLKDAYHTKCRGCHTKSKKKYPGAPSTSDCSACHIKEVDNFIKERIEKNKSKK